MTDWAALGPEQQAKLNAIRHGIAVGDLCAYCGGPGAGACCSQHPAVTICQPCRDARKGSKHPHRTPDEDPTRAEQGGLQPPYPARFVGAAFLERLAALRVTSSKATPCTICGRLLITAVGSHHAACVQSDRPPVPIAELLTDAVSALAVTADATREPRQRR